MLQVTHEELMQLTAFVGLDGVVWASKISDIDASGFKKLPTYIFHKNAINPEYANLLGAAIILYRINQETAQTLELIVEVLEKHGGDALVEALTNCQAALQTARRCAIEGMENVAGNSKNNLT